VLSNPLQSLVFNLQKCSHTFENWYNPNPKKDEDTFMTALRVQTQTKKNFESVALQHFQNFSCGSFDR